MGTLATGSSPPPPASLPAPPSPVQSPFSWFAWGVLAFNLVVIVWGAYVRASKSGDGCGSHWPFCNGQVMPTVSKIQTLVEFSHRISSGLALVGVFALCLWAYRSLPKGSQERLFATCSVIFILIEGALGAGLVLFRLVAGNTSLTRAVYLSAHLTNTLLLIGALTLTAWVASHPGARISTKLVPRPVGAALIAAIVVCISGAVAALGDTLFPAISLSSGFKEDFASGAPVLLQLRLFHPVLAGLAGLYLLYIVLSVPSKMKTQSVREIGALVAVMVLVQVVLGILNIALLAPIWMQLVHLLASQLLWIFLVLLTAETGSKYPSLASPTA